MKRLHNEHSMRELFVPVTSDNIWVIKGTKERCAVNHSFSELEGALLAIPCCGNHLAVAGPIKCPPRESHPALILKQGLLQTARSKHNKDGL